jgi:aspartate 4-decarboxylase
VEKFRFHADAFVHELVDSIIGDNYPVPDRMLVHNEQIVREYLQWAMCGEPRPTGRFDLYAVEGGTAAMCYLFKSLKANRLLNPGDTIAVATPVFTPYLEMPHLEDYDLKMVFIPARQEQRWQYTDDDLKPLRDPAVKAFFVVNPGNPYAVALSPESIANIGKVLQARPELMLLTDDVYGTFVYEFRSLLGEFPAQHARRVLLQQVFRMYRMAPWRDGAARGQRLRSAHCRSPEAIARALDKRYAPLTLEPRTLRFIDRIVADSRDVALNHTAGLSLPQQVMMTLFSVAELYDEKKIYQQTCIDIVRTASTVDDRGPRDRGRSQPALRLVLRPRRFRVLAAQVRGRRRRSRG